MARIYFDEHLERKIWKDDYRGQTYRLPALFADRYTPERILAKGGFGVLIVARDRHVFERQVLIKKSVLADHLFMQQRNNAVSRAIDKNRNLSILERKMLLHGQLREILSIPVLVDWFEELDPMIYGPHHDQEEIKFFITDDTLYSGSNYLVLNFFDGIPLDDYCTGSHFTRNLVGSIRHLGLYLATILQKFHKEQTFGPGNPVHFIYQDLKPDNILCSPFGTFQLIDFGSFAAISSQGKFNVGVHTMPYAAPESLPAGGGQISPRSDIYSLGMLLRILLQTACNVPIKNDETFENWTLDANLRSFIIKATNQNPDRRFQNMGEVIPALNKISKHGGVNHA